MRLAVLQRDIIFWRKMFDNLSSYEKALTWIRESMIEVANTYAIPHFDPKFFDTENLVCVDVGANVGAFVLKAIATQRFKRICAFEPFVGNIEIMNSILIDNQLQDKVEIFQNAIYKENKNDVPLHAYHFKCSGDIYLDEEPNSDKDTGLTCQALTLSRAMELLEVERIHYLKMDVEGAEHEIFKNFNEFDKIDVLAIEIHHDNSELIQLLSEHFIFVDIYGLCNENPEDRVLTDIAVEKHITNMEILTHPEINIFLCFNKNSKGITFNHVT